MQKRPRPQHDPAYRGMCVMLKDARTGARLTQRTLAARLSRPPSFIWKVEAAERRIDPVELVRWCRACDTDPVEVFKRVTARVPKGSR